MVLTLPLNAGKHTARQRLGLRRSSAAFGPVMAIEKRQGTGAVQNLAPGTEVQENGAERVGCAIVATVCDRRIREI